MKKNKLLKAVIISLMFYCPACVLIGVNIPKAPMLMATAICLLITSTYPFAYMLKKLILREE